MAHYAGQCSTCHTTEDWQTIIFDHAGAGDCLQCHQAPSAHYQSGCTNCHNTTNWHEVNFSHSGLDNCLSCHSKSDHYGGQCSDCHNTGSWGMRVSTMAPTTQAACHAEDANRTIRSYESHHNTGGWEDAHTIMKACGPA